MSSTLSKIHVTNSTGLSLNERFTAISTQPKVVTNIGSGRRSRSRSRSVQRQVPVAAAAAERVTSRANQRLLAQLQRKHKVQAALKLKRRSMRTVGGRTNGSGGGGANGRIRRGTVKAFRVGANGKPIRTNSLTRIATMNADRELTKNRGRPLRRSNSSNNLANRLGPRRPTAGGAAQRVAKRNIDRQRGRNSVGGRGRSNNALNNNRGRSRSRSRTRTLSDNGRNGNRSRTRNNSDNQLNNRSRSRNRNLNNSQTTNNNNNNNNNIRRGRSRSRSRGRAAGTVNKSNLPIKARLGVRPGGGAAPTTRGTNNRRGRNASLTRRGVQTGRVQKRRNSTNVNAAGNDNNNGRGGGRLRSRSAGRNGNVRSRSRSRTRKGQVGQQRQQQQQGSGQVRQQRNNRAPRGRQQTQRRGNNTSNGQRGGTNNNGKAQQAQQRRGRSRSRTGRGGNTRNQGNKSGGAGGAATKPAVNKDALDKELDQYMATTKTEHDMDYLLKN